jgi:hypothetical protein
MNEHEEYLRRNMVHAGAAGVHADINHILDKLRSFKRTPQWIKRELADLLARSERSVKELAKWRDDAPDAPWRQNP